MAQAMREAVDAARDSGGIVKLDDKSIKIEWSGDVPLEVDDLIRDNDWLITPSSGSECSVTLFKGYNE